MGDDKMNQMRDWQNCETRGGYLRNSLRHEIKRLRNRERGCQVAYSKDYMGKPSKYLGELYGKAAVIFEEQLKLLDDAGA